MVNNLDKYINTLRHSVIPIHVTVIMPIYCLGCLISCNNYRKTIMMIALIISIVTSHETLIVCH